MTAEHPVLVAPLPRAATRSSIAAADRTTAACAVGATVGLVPFLLVLWDFGLRPLRGMTASGVNANFFELQARALFHGHLDVPPGSLGIEAFVVDGRHYMYFGPFPALLRMPILLLTDRLDGRLTAVSMLVGWFVLAAALTVLVRRVRVLLRGDAPVGRFEAIGLGAVVATVTGGSTVVFLASQPWVYHEVYIWSTALTVAAVASLIAAWEDPRGRRVTLTGALAVAVMLTRSTAGWAIALAVVATGLWFLAGRRRQGAVWRRAGWGLVMAGAATMLAGSLVNWAKFRHPYLFPIEDQVWTQLSAHRRFVVADNGGALNGLQFVPTTLAAYLRPDGVRFVSVFPFITQPADPPSAFGGVLFDEAWRTGSIPALMPLLFVLTVWGAIAAVRRRAAAATRIPLLGCALMTGGVLAFGYVAQRYTSEFLPLLALGATIGFVDLASRLRSVTAHIRHAAVTAVCLLAAFGIVAHVSIGVVNARRYWRGDRLADLVGLQATVGDAIGRPLRDRVHVVDALPAHSEADDLAVLGDCDAIFVGTGETYGPWIAVDHRDRSFDVEVSASGVRPGSTSLMWFSGYTLRRLQAQVNLAGQLRLVMIGASPDTSGHWLDIEPGDTVGVLVADDTEGNRFVATASVERTAQRSVVEAPMTEWNRQFRSVPIFPSVALNGRADAGRIGLQVSVGPGLPPPLCDRLRTGPRSQDW
jgi:hypothetical protein